MSHPDEIHTQDAFHEQSQEVERIAARVGLRCATLSASQAIQDGLPCVGTPVEPYPVHILWNTDRRPIFAYWTRGPVMEFTAMVLQPAIELGLSVKFSERQLASLASITRGIAHMVAEDTMRTLLRDDSVVVVRRLGSSIPHHAADIEKALNDLMTVQNIFRQCLHGEPSDQIMDHIARESVIADLPKSSRTDWLTESESSAEDRGDRGGISGDPDRPPPCA